MRRDWTGENWRKLIWSRVDMPCLCLLANTPKGSNGQGCVLGTVWVRASVNCCGPVMLVIV